jgi:hypothetical protein
MKFLGRQQIKAALAYCQPYSLADDEYLCEAAKAVGEATQLIESGFDYVTDMHGCKLFKKRK